MKTILIVDDEVPILKSLSRLFFDTNIEVLTAESGSAALELMRSHTVDLVLSDMRMPFMDGYEFLSQVKADYPSIIRVILSGYSDEKTIFKAILHNIAQLYLFKPWNNDELLRSIEQLLDTADLLSSKDLLILFNNLESLPALPSCHQEILEMIERDEDIQVIADAIEKDPCISSRLLHVANSAFYGLHTGSVKQATLSIGLPNIRSLICSTSMLNTSEFNEEDRIWVERLWKHSLLTSKLLHFIYDELLKKQMPEAAYSAGILHNIGLFLLLHNYFEPFLKLMDQTQKSPKCFLQREREEFNVTHQEVGAYLARWWGLPFPLVEVALYHHRPLDQNIINTELVACVNIAQHYAWLLMKEPILIEFSPELFDHVGIKMEEFEAAIKNNTWI